MPQKKRKRKMSLDSVLSHLRKLGRDPADVVVAFRFRMNDEGGWSVQWDAAHWLDFDKGHEPPAGCLPPGVAEEIAKRMSYHAAQRAGGQAFASFGASFGRAAIEQLSEVIPHITRFRKDG